MKNKEFTPIPEREDHSGIGSVTRQDETSIRLESNKRSGENLALYEAASRQYKTNEPDSFSVTKHATGPMQGISKHGQ